MENDFLIKIDALEDQIHGMATEIEAKDSYITRLGGNPNDAPKT